MIDNVIYMCKRQFLTNQSQEGRLLDNYTTLNSLPLENSKYSINMSKSVYIYIFIYVYIYFFLLVYYTIESAFFLLWIYDTSNNTFYASISGLLTSLLSISVNELLAKALSCRRKQKIQSSTYHIDWDSF